MTKSVFKLALLACATLSVAACAGKKPEVVTPPPAVVEQPATPPAYTPPPPADTKPLPPTGPVPGSQQDFVVNVGDRVFFDLDQSSLREDAKALLDKQAAWLVRYPAVKVRIEGNADERGTREYNFALGARRAESVSQYLTSKGVVPSRISTISYGKENPIATGADEQAWSQNRNAHTAITEGAQ